MLKKVLIGCGSVIGLVLAFFVALGAWMAIANDRAHADAVAFCARMTPGADVAFVEAAAAAHERKPRYYVFDGVPTVTFQGGIFYGALCQVTIVDGKVAATAVEIQDD